MTDLAEQIARAHYEAFQKRIDIQLIDFSKADETVREKYLHDANAVLSLPAIAEALSPKEAGDVVERVERIIATYPGMGGYIAKLAVSELVAANLLRTPAQDSAPDGDKK